MRHRRQSAVAKAVRSPLYRKRVEVNRKASQKRGYRKHKANQDYL